MIDNEFLDEHDTGAHGREPEYNAAVEAHNRAEERRRELYAQATAEVLAAHKAAKRAGWWGLWK